LDVSIGGAFLFVNFLIIQEVLMVEENKFNGLLTFEELAERLKVSKQFLYNLSSPRNPAYRRIPSIKVGKLRRFNYKTVIEYFQNQGEIRSNRKI
jgi:excisionase family DNA binding protein